MIMSQRWTLCLLALLGASAGEDAKLHLTHFATTIKPRINGKYTGCSVSQQVLKFTCDDPQGAGTDAIPDKAFRTVVNCKNMGEDFSAVKLLPGPECGKLVFTQYTAAGAKVSAGQVLLLKGEVANITCVAWPFSGGTGFNPDPEGFYQIGKPVTLEATGTNMRNEESSPEFWEIGGVQAKTGNQEKVAMSACDKAVEDVFKWKLSLIKSSQNVHELQWSSQPEEPNYLWFPNVQLEDSLPSKATFCLKDVAFKQIKAQVLSANVLGTLGDVKNAVQLQTAADAPRDLTGKHEETMKLVVDATQLPKEGEKRLNVGIRYQTPGSEEVTTYLEVPIADPNVPDSQPDDKPKDQPDQPAPDQPAPDQADKGGGLGAGFWIILILVLMGLGVGAFLYRRNMLIQAHARQPLP